MTVMAADERFMARALQLAQRGLYSTHPNPRVGCVIVRDGDIVGEGWHERAGKPHAEVNALQLAGERARGATAYVTLEPCSHHGRTPPCADALIAAGVSAVVVAVEDANPAVAGRGLTRLRDAGITVRSGVLEGPARDLNAGFLRVMAGGRPRVRAKVAASLDGRTAMASGESQWVTGPAARADVQRLRAQSAAIVTGAGTALADNPALTVRPEQIGDTGERPLPAQQPLRVVLDSALSLAPDSALVTGPGRCVVMTGAKAQKGARVAQLEEAGAEVVAVRMSDERTGRPDLTAVLEWLAQASCHDVLVEAGPTLTGAFIAANLVDELWLYQAPTLLGSRGRPLAELPFDTMAQQRRWHVTDRRQIGQDQRLILTPTDTDVG